MKCLHQKLTDLLELLLVLRYWLRCSKWSNHHPNQSFLQLPEVNKKVRVDATDWEIPKWFHQQWSHGSLIRWALLPQFLWFQDHQLRCLISQSIDYDQGCWVVPSRWFCWIAWLQTKVFGRILQSCLKWKFLELQRSWKYLNKYPQRTQVHHLLSRCPESQMLSVLIDRLFPSPWISVKRRASSRFRRLPRIILLARSLSHASRAWVLGITFVSGVDLIGTWTTLDLLLYR